jgi:hypothetical protein
LNVLKNLPIILKWLKRRKKALKNGDIITRSFVFEMIKGIICADLFWTYDDKYEVFGGSFWPLLLFYQPLVIDKPITFKYNHE